MHSLVGSTLSSLSVMVTILPGSKESSFSPFGSMVSPNIVIERSKLFLTTHLMDSIALMSGAQESNKATNNIVIFLPALRNVLICKNHHPDVPLIQKCDLLTPRKNSGQTILDLMGNIFQHDLHLQQYSKRNQFVQDKKYCLAICHSQAYG